MNALCPLWNVWFRTSFTHLTEHSQTDWLLLFRNTIAVYSDDDLKDINAICGQVEAFVVLKQGVHRVTNQLNRGEPS
jgi:hypothetical protein